MSPIQVALLSLIVGMGFATVVLLLSMLVDLVKAARINLRRWGHPVCKVCGDPAAPGDDEYCWRHLHLRTLYRKEHTVTAEPR